MDQDGLLYVGCYTPDSGGSGVGVTALRRERATGALRPLGVVAASPSPSFLARHPFRPVLYAVNELDAGTVSAWAVAPGGALSALGHRSTGGAAPCHLAVHPAGRHLMVANYGDGSVAVLPLDPGGVPGERSDLLVHHGHGPDPERQARAHAHMVCPDDGGGLILAVDLGTDHIYRYELEAATGRLVASHPPVRTPAGTGPRHVARGPGRLRHVVGELSATVITYELDPESGAMVRRGEVAASEHGTQAQPSEIAVRADGRFLYVANRGPDTLAVFALETGVPRWVAEVPARGRWPRHFALMDGFLYVANERSHTVVTFRLDRETGVPRPTTGLDLPSPTCVMPFGGN